MRSEDNTGSASSFPIRLTGRLDPDLSRGMWLVKWLLALPHVVVLAFLWVGYLLMTIGAGSVILFTGRYPRSVFDFNVGVMRWTWRVTYYAFGVIGTDQYPPFTLEDTDYPAKLDVTYPDELSRGLVLVKWWLLALPHYVVVGLFTGEMLMGTGLVGFLVLFAGVALLFSGSYPAGLFDFLMGIQRWVYRVWAYAGLMTDVFPPFRFDGGGDEPKRPKALRTDPSGSGTGLAAEPAV